MVDLGSLDASIASLDWALARAGVGPRDPMVAQELLLCVTALASQPLPPELDTELGMLFSQAIALARAFDMARPESIAPLRVTLFDIAAAISVRARD